MWWRAGPLIYTGLCHCDLVCCQDMWELLVSSSSEGRVLGPEILGP